MLRERSRDTKKLQEQHYSNSKYQETDEYFDLHEFCQYLIDAIWSKASVIISQPQNNNIFNFRSFYTKNEKKYLSKQKNSNSFRFVTYNLLADHLIKAENYLSFEKKYIQKENRIKNIFE